MKVQQSILKLSLWCILIAPSMLLAQLKPSIGVSSLPGDNEPICSYPMPVNPDMTFDSYPFFSGDTIPDFTFYDLDDNPMNMATQLTNGKPIVIVGLNYTCPYVRNQVPIYNDILDNYSDLVDIIGIYHLEAHPDDNFSPNSGTFGNVSVNVNQGIVVNQHSTYLERKEAAQDLINATGLNIPVYIDGPCNEWWTNFGPGPATGYIIKPNGTVFVKHGWFDKYANGHDIYCDIDELFGTICNGSTPDGQFTFALTTNDTIYGAVGTTIDGEADLVNNSASDVLIEIDRNQNDLDAGWETAICADICLTPTADSYIFLLPAGVTQHFYMHFYSDSNTPGQSHTKMAFRNVNDFSNQYVQDFYAFSSETTGIEEADKNIQSLTVFPNPTSDQNIQISFSSTYVDSYTFSLLNQYGQTVNVFYQNKTIGNGEQSYSLNLEGIPSGMYFISVESEQERIVKKFIKR